MKNLYLIGVVALAVGCLKAGAAYPRVSIELDYALNAKNTFSILIAPLTIKSAGISQKDTRFQEALLPANTDVNATYQFNSYRLTYPHEFIKDRPLQYSSTIGSSVVG